jgi:hypothetical protein
MNPSPPGQVEAAPVKPAPALRLRGPSGRPWLEVLGGCSLVLTLVSGLALYNGLHQAQVAYRAEPSAGVELVAEALPVSLPADPQTVTAAPALPKLPEAATPPPPITLVAAQGSQPPADVVPGSLADATATPATPPASIPENPSESGPRILPAGAALSGQISDEHGESVPSIVIRARPQNP